MSGCLGRVPSITRRVVIGVWSTPNMGASPSESCVVVASIGADTDVPTQSGRV